MYLLILKILKAFPKDCYRVTFLKTFEDGILLFFVGDERLIPEGQISLIFSEEFNCYMIKDDLRNFEKYYLH